jgi:hypothetical protein
MRGPPNQEKGSRHSWNLPFLGDKRGNVALSLSLLRTMGTLFRKEIQDSKEKEGIIEA